jgi:hypothetical protein
MEPGSRFFRPLQPRLLRAFGKNAGWRYAANINGTLFFDADDATYEKEKKGKGVRNLLSPYPLPRMPISLTVTFRNEPSRTHPAR